MQVGIPTMLRMSGLRYAPAAIFIKAS
jgi:hypothetical protein